MFAMRCVCRLTAPTASIINPWIFLLSAPMLILFLWLRNYYMSAGRDIKRLEANARSPVYSHLSVTLNGLATIRVCAFIKYVRILTVSLVVQCHNASQRFLKQMHDCQNYHGKSFYMVSPQVLATGAATLRTLSVLDRIEMAWGAT